MKYDPEILLIHTDYLAFFWRNYLILPSKDQQTGKNYGNLLGSCA